MFNTRGEFLPRLDTFAWLFGMTVGLVGLGVFGLAAPSLVFAQPVPGQTAEIQQVPLVTTPNQARTGTLLFEAQDHGQFVEAPRLATDFDIEVSGPTARTQLTQHFVNPTEGWVEAVYVFPLPETAAVDTLKMVIGNRVVVGKVKERSEARVIYEKAKAAGKKAALIEQQRPNVFTHRVANIGPGESIVVQLEYQQTVLPRSGAYSLRVPLVVAPRYHPKPNVQVVDYDPNGKGRALVRDPVPDRAELVPPVLDPRNHPPTNPVALTVRLNAGFALGDVTSSYHAIDIDEMGEDHRTITLSDGAVPADRDFELAWRPKAGTAPQVGLFKERVGDDEYLLAMVTPPAPAENGAKSNATLSREVIFVIDNSGSMGGTSIRQAKKGLLFGLDRLRKGDRFNIVRFDDTYSALFSQPVAADLWHVTQAKTFVRSLEAAGGTEMVPPMMAALYDTGGSDTASVRQVVFLTDGAIGNEKQLLEVIGEQRGRSRVFMVGIGSAPNTYLMSRAAELGRGTFTHIGAMNQVEERMKVLFEKLESPVVTGLSAKFAGTKVDATPGMLPDLYRGEPVVLAAKLGSTAGQIEITGMNGDQPWYVTTPLSGAAQGKGISKLWARRKIADAEVGLRLQTIDNKTADARILKLGLEHGLVSRLTSLVAVDDGATRPATAKLTRADVPLNLPAGWDFDKVFGTNTWLRLERADGQGKSNAHAKAQNPTNVLPKLQAARYAKIATAKTPSSKPKGRSAIAQPMNLPQGATDAELRMFFGIVCAFFSLILLWFARHARIKVLR